jgi:hypothetical protein
MDDLQPDLPMTAQAGTTSTTSTRIVGMGMSTPLPMIRSKGTVFTSPPPPSHTPHLESLFSKDQFRQWHQQSSSSRSPTGRLPKLNFPKFKGDNPKLWKTRCENYFEMYDVDEGIWVKIASMHPGCSQLNEEFRLQPGLSFAAGSMNNSVEMNMNS